jgi:predicted nucleic acid-binding protein
VSLTTLEQTIPPGDLILLDTTTVISHFKGSEPASPAATHVIEQFVETGRNHGVVSAVTAMELLVDPLKRRDQTLYHQMIFFLTQTLHLQLAPVDFRVAHRAADLRAHFGLKAPDALILATGYAASVRHLVCNDAEWKKLRISGQAISVCYLEDHIPFR